jgi:hypothetical protein
LLHSRRWLSFDVSARTLRDPKPSIILHSGFPDALCDFDGRVVVEIRVSSHSRPTSTAKWHIKHAVTLTAATPCTSHRHPVGLPSPNAGTHLVCAHLFPADSFARLLDQRAMVSSLSSGHRLRSWFDTGDFWSLTFVPFGKMSAAPHALCSR